MYFIIVQLIAAIVLLLWAVRMVRTAVERAYAAELKRTLGRAERSRLGAAVIGMVLAIALQSSTAVGAMGGTISGGGLVSVAAGRARLLGAEHGSAVVAPIH